MLRSLLIVRVLKPQGVNTNAPSNGFCFVILSAAKNLSFKAAEILRSAALRSE